MHKPFIHAMPKPAAGYPCPGLPPSSHLTAGHAKPPGALAEICTAQLKCKGTLMRRVIQTPHKSSNPDILCFTGTIHKPPLPAFKRWNRKIYLIHETHVGQDCVPANNRAFFVDFYGKHRLQIHNCCFSSLVQNALSLTIDLIDCARTCTDPTFSHRSMPSYCYASQCRYYYHRFYELSGLCKWA